MNIYYRLRTENFTCVECIFEVSLGEGTIVIFNAVILKQCFIVVMKNVDSGPRLGFKIVSMSQVMDLGKVLIV